MAKFVVLLMIVGACTAFPVEEEVRPPSEVGASVRPNVLVDPIPVPQQEQGVVAPVPEQGSVQQNLDKSDLKTDNSYWWGRSYYPVAYRSYYRPRVYSYYAPRSYSYYTPYYYDW